MTDVHGGSLAARQLKAEGIDTIFGLFAGHLGPLYDACLEEGIRTIGVRHEEAAVHMAYAWARLRRQAAVAVVTAGPGVANSISGLANAWCSNAPVLLLGGRWPTRQEHMGAFHEIDQLSLVRPLTGWAATCQQADRIPEYVSTALRQARAGSPAYLDIPSDILRSQTELEAVWFPEANTKVARPAADPAAIERALDMLAAATRPLLIAGSGVWWAGAEGELERFLAVSQLPALTTIAARGIVPADHPLHFGAARSFAMSEADVVLVLGARFNWALGYGRPPRLNPAARLIQIDRDPREIGRNRSVTLGIQADLGEALRQLAGEAGRRLRPQAWQQWREALRQRHEAARARLAEQRQSQQVPVHPARLCAEIGRILERDAIIVADGGDILSFARQGLDVYTPGAWLDAGTFGIIGQGVPFGIGAKLAWPQRQVLVLCGDGAFGFNGFEVETAVRHGVPLVVVISNNGAWSIEQHTQRMEFGRTVATELSPARYDLLAQALGALGLRVERPEEIRPALEKALAAGRPAVVDVVTDPQTMSPDAQRQLGLVPLEQPVVFQGEPGATASSQR